MDVSSSLDIARPAPEVFALVEDLDRYPEWLNIVPRVERVDGDPGDPGPAWSVELRGRLGPLARSKRLRMVRTVHDPATHLRFERRELDGRDHSPWVLEAEITPRHGEQVTLTMRLHYGGSFGGVVLERMLRQEIDRSKPRLLALLTTPA